MSLWTLLKFTGYLGKFIDGSLFGVPAGWDGLQFVRVGVHVRRGDFIGGWARSRGHTVADQRYIQRAMGHFVERWGTSSGDGALRGAMGHFVGRFPRVQFVVVSNDIRWCQKHVAFNGSGVDVVFSVGHNTGEDLALLASCDHTVMTTGTFSWWGGQLANFLVNALAINEEYWCILLVLFVLTTNSLPRDMLVMTSGSLVCYIK